MNINYLSSKTKMMLMEIISNASVNVGQEREMVSKLSNKFEEYMNDEDKLLKSLIMICADKMVSSGDMDRTFRDKIEALYIEDKDHFANIKDNVDKLDTSFNKNIILDESGMGFKLLSYGYDELIRRKADKGLGDTWTKEFIDKNIYEVWFRCDSDLIDIAHEIGLGAILHRFKIINLNPNTSADINTDKRLKVEECEAYGFEERLIIELA